jgi:RHS repeat-associated protein
VYTDALGSPIASSTWGNGGLERTRYEPYGATLPGTTVRDGVGYTGHVNDPDTGLVYMQQRYYEPLAGRFLSVDPVTTSAKDGSSFNRYAYAQDNPYKYSDPDGRNPKLAVDFALNVALNLATSGEFGIASALTETLIGALNPAKTLQTAVKVGEALKDAAKGGDKVVYRLGADKESASRLARKSGEAEQAGFPHGVSVSTTKPPAGTACSSASCATLEASGMNVHHTPTRNDPNHHTVELPKPVTAETAAGFNEAFGRK